MTETEALGVVAYLAAAFPRNEFPEATASVWLAEIVPEEAPDGAAMEAARRCVRSGRFCPSIAEYLAELKAVRKERRLAAATPALPSSDEDVSDLSDPAALDALIGGVNAELVEHGREPVLIGHDVPDGARSVSQTLRAAFPQVFGTAGA